MNKIKEIYNNKWVRFGVMSTLWILIFTIWTELWYTIFFVIFIYDYYITKKYKKLFADKYIALRDKNKSIKYIVGWIEAIVFALIVATLIKTYFVELYVIPTPSMEKTLMVGDYIVVNKMAYGPKMPNTPLSIPLVHNTSPFNADNKSYSEQIKWPYKRLAGSSKVERNDVIVFNYPQGDTVLQIYPQSNYYEFERQYGKSELEKMSKIISHPVDKRDNYIKRAVAIPGDTLEIIAGDVYIDSVKEKLFDTKQDVYNIQFNPNAITATMLGRIGVPGTNIISLSSNHLAAMLTKEQADKLSTVSGVQNSIRLNNIVPNADVFPYDTPRYPFSEHNLGPIVIPERDVTIDINIDNLPLYYRIIAVYENNKLEVKPNGDIYINDIKSDKYTFKMDYFFAMGDNRDNSLDSRFFGFIPEDHLVGKASFIWFSSDKDKSFPNNIRFDRIFKPIE